MKVTKRYKGNTPQAETGIILIETTHPDPRRLIDIIEKELDEDQFYCTQEDIDNIFLFGDPGWYVGPAVYNEDEEIVWEYGDKSINMCDFTLTINYEEDCYDN